MLFVMKSPPTQIKITEQKFTNIYLNFNSIINLKSHTYLSFIYLFHYFSK